MTAHRIGIRHTGGGGSIPAFGRNVRPALLALLCSSFAFASPGHADSASPTSLTSLDNACKSLSSLRLRDTTITRAETVSTGNVTYPADYKVDPGIETTYTQLPDFCRVLATISPVPGSSIRVEMWLPEQSKWNGRFLGTGNGAFGGTIIHGALANGVKNGYAVINTDMGTFPSQLSWEGGYGYLAGIGFPQRVIDWGWRSTRLMTVVGKQLVRSFYQQAAKHSYFAGCSTGGHQALSEAQKFPHDYEGIVAGSPGQNRTQLHAYFSWTDLLSAKHPEYAIAAAQAQLVRKAALAQCVGKDGG